MVPKICCYLDKQDNQKEHREKYKSKHLYGQHVTFIWEPLSYTKSRYHRWTLASSDLVPKEYHQQAWTWYSEGNTCKPQTWHSEGTIWKSWLSSLNLTHKTLPQYLSQLPASKKSARDTIAFGLVIPAPYVMIFTCKKLLLAIHMTTKDLSRWRSNCFCHLDYFPFPWGVQICYLVQGLIWDIALFLNLYLIYFPNPWDFCSWLKAWR